MRPPEEKTGGPLCLRPPVRVTTGRAFEPPIPCFGERFAVILPRERRERQEPREHRERQEHRERREPRYRREHR
jgi:hypothetical protein